jgi:hypothetical protein
LDLVGLSANGQRTSRVAVARAHDAHCYCFCVALPIRVTSDPGARLRLIERTARSDEDEQKVRLRFAAVVAAANPKQSQRLEDIELQATLAAEQQAAQANEQAVHASVVLPVCRSSILVGK